MAGGTHRTLVRARSLELRPNVHRDGMLLVGLVIGLAIANGRFAAPVDAINYWNAGTSTDLYPQSWSEVRGGLLFYPPPVAQVMRLLQPIGWPAFVTGLMVATFASIWYCAREWSFPLLLIGVPYYLLGVAWLTYPATFLSYALLGNLQWILAALVLVALERPVVWAVLLVTKVTTAIGWWWHPLRGEWRAASIGAVTSAVVVGISIAIDPLLWVEFFAFMKRNASMANPPMELFFVPLPVRLAIAAGMLIWGARTDRTLDGLGRGRAIRAGALWARVPAVLVAPAREVASRRLERVSARDWRRRVSLATWTRSDG